MSLADEDGLWRLDECEVTMLRGVAWVDGSACRIEVDLDRAECVLTVGGDEDEQPTRLTVPVAIEPDVRERLRTSLQGTHFHVGKNLRRSDTLLPEDE